MTNKTSTLTYRWMEEVWNNGREDAIEEMMHAHAAIHGLEGVNAPGAAGFKTFYHSFREQFPRIHVDVEDVVCEGNVETARHRVTGTNALGQPVEFTGMTCIRMEGGKIAEGWNSFDFMTMYNQLGYRMVSAQGVTA